MINESILEKLKEILAQMPQLANPAEQPAQFVRDLHRQWKEDGGKVDGGKVAGKPRHSDRYLEDQLIAQGSRVRSLTPKLVGKTNINPADGGILVRFILSNWPEPCTEDGEVTYKPFLPNTEIDAVADYIEDQLVRSPAMSAAYPSEAADGSASDELPGEPNAELITRLFRESDVMITVAPEQTFVSVGPKTELIEFRDLIDSLRQIEAMDQKPRLLIWVLDLGGPSFDDLSTRMKYLNVQQLIPRFKALLHYRDAHSENLLDWLRSRAAIVLLDTYGDWRMKAKLNISQLPNFSSHHATLTTTTTEWMASPRFRALYGANLEEDRMRQRVFQVFFKASAEWDSDPDIEEELRYFGFASFTKSDGETVGRGLELPPLPARYAEAFRTVCVAAASVLGIKIAAPKSFQRTGEEAIRQLDYLGYRILSMDQFLEEY